MPRPPFSCQKKKIARLLYARYIFMVGRPVGRTVVAPPLIFPGGIELLASFFFGLVMDSSPRSRVGALNR